MKKILESWEKFLIEQVIPTQKELIDIKKLIDGTRADLRILASIYMNENNNAM